MKKKEKIKNIPSSIRRRLLNIARESGKPFEALLLRYFQERLLYRISISKYKEQFILKGGLLFLIYNIPEQRITKDIDLLGTSETNDVEKLKSIFLDIISIDLADGINFIKETIQVNLIMFDKVDRGKRITMTAELAKAKLPLQIDIGYGDTVFPEPYKLKLSPLLDFPEVELKVYSRESVIAEKLHVIVSRKILNSRMKDFYDILYLARHQNFNIKTLMGAIEETFHNRKTTVENIKTIFQNEFKTDKNMQKKWDAFLRRFNLSSIKDFSELMINLESFLKPVCTTEGEISKDMLWNKEKWEWI